jgi:riboflavin synthase
MGRVSAIDDDDGRRLTIAYNPANHDLIVYKGSITIDGVALTLTSVAEKTFQVAIIPYTLKHTTLSSLKVGDEVNLEFDVIGKYVSRIVSKHET